MRLRRTARGGAVGDVHVPAQACSVEKRFGAELALAGVDLRLEQGEVLALLGPNGAGKTTLVSILLGLRRPDMGTARLFGADPRQASTRLRIGTVLQDVSFPGTLRVRELVELVSAHYPDPIDRDELLGRFSLTAVARRQAGGLSGGQRRRLAVALSFVGRPRAVFLDEPSAGLDLESRLALWEVIRDFARDGGSVLLTTHQLDEAEALASRVSVINKGRIVADGTVAELRARTGQTRVRLRAQNLPVLRAATQVDQQGEFVTLHTRDAAELLEELRALGIRLDGLEVTALSLEEAFLELTREGGPQ